MSVPAVAPVPRRKALIAGATGVVGRNLLRHLLATREWDIVAVSRRKPDIEGAYTHIAVDLMNAPECKAKLGHLNDVTHIFFAALAANREIAQAAVDNLALLRNLVEAVEPVARGLEH
ncbi:MAG TPA: NAD-dependent epimerase/dehydratase family protein, partial [Opitutaceae bacterium]|nr:NAD-dependent epimerase/dehydratase family protein [Opitutaceae bacterium]